MLLRLAYLPVTNLFALPRLLPLSDRDKDREIRPTAASTADLPRKRTSTLAIYGYR